MSVDGSQDGRAADEIVKAINAKVTAHKAVVARSPHGTITWRRNAKGGYEIELKPTL